jgi:hypothetical protein
MSAFAPIPDGFICSVANNAVNLAAFSTARCHSLRRPMFSGLCLAGLHIRDQLIDLLARQRAPNAQHKRQAHDDQRMRVDQILCLLLSKSEKTLDCFGRPAAQ